MEAGSVIANSIKLVRPLGEGGMGAVWLADHQALETQVVVKFMHQALGADPASRERFSREAVAASKVKSPHVVQTFDHGVTPDGIAFIVMERLEGEDLAHRIEKGTLSPKEVALVLTQTCRALGRAHVAGIVHRDIKPDNIFLCDVGSDEPFVKLLDFGIAKASLNPMLDNKTRTGAMMGTPYYMSPEQFAGTKGIDLRTDLWSLGIVAFECLVGKRPFDADTIGGLAIAVHSGELPLPSQFRPELQAFDAWFAKACCRQPDGRFASAKEFADAFEAAARQAGAIEGGVAPTGPVFSTTNPEGIPQVPPALLLSTGATGAVAVQGVTAAGPEAIPKSGMPKGVIFAAAAVVGLLAIGGVVLMSRGGSTHSVASSEPPTKVEVAAPAPPPAPKAPEVALGALPTSIPTVAAAPDPAPAPAAAAASPHTTTATHGSGPSTPVVAAQAATGAHVAAAPAATHTTAAPPKGPANCNPPFTIDGNGVKHPKLECL
jgi:serine/threonine-protein kinase